MKTKITVLLTALLMLVGMSVHAQDSPSDVKDDSTEQAQSAVEGDVTGDGKVDKDDIEEVVKIITGDSDNANGDVTGDGKVNVADIVAIVRIMMTPTTPPTRSDAKVNITIKNTTSKDIIIRPKLTFFLNNKGQCVELVVESLFGDDIKTIAAGGEETFNNIEIPGSKDYLDSHFADREVMNIANIPANVNNVTLYDQNWNSSTIVPDMIEEAEEFNDGGEYTVFYSVESQPEPQTEPQTDPQESQTDPQTEPEILPVVNGNPVININVNITNNTGSPQYLDGRLRFVLGNPDHNGTYYGGYRGDYLRTDNIYFSPTSIVLGAGETRRFTNLSWRDADTGCGLGETSPLNPGRLPILDDHGGIAYARNVLMYIGGRSDLVLCDNMDPGIIFKDGGSYDIVISGGSAPAPQPVSGGTNPVISFGVRITNAHGSGLTLDGRLRFVLGNPDHNGTYYGGYMGDYLRTDNIWFSSGSVYLAPGETRTFYGLSWRDADTGCGLGETSPLNPGRLPIRSDDGGIAYARNVLIYIGGRSDLILCDNLSGSLIFQQDGMYDIVIR